MPTPPSEEQVQGYFEDCNNWGRWGTEDQLGTMNYLTPANRKQAASLVREGISVSCARKLVPNEKAPDVRDPVQHFMMSSGDKWRGVPRKPGETQTASDYIGIAFHGFHVTHIDSLSHVFHHGQMYNGVPSSAVSTAEGATKGPIEVLSAGVLTRGVLIDVPRLKGVDWLEPGTPVFPEELEAAERQAGLRVEAGDALLVRTGRFKRRGELGPAAPTSFSGLHGACVPWVHRREVALLGGDGINDALPSGYSVRIPFHDIGISRMGLWLMDDADLEELAQTCERHSRWEFMLSIGPLRIVNGTGSPVNPIATF